MQFACIDQHISVVADLRSTFTRFGHTIKEYSLSGHSPVIGRPNAKIPMLMGDNWCNTIQTPEKFYEAYKDEFNKFDAFICCYPPIFSMLYEKFNKPILIYIPIRYECGADNNPDLWRKFNSFLQRDNVFLTANNLFDKKYTEGFINKEVEHIPSLCDYTGMTYNPTNEQFLYFAGFKINDESGRMILKHDALKAGHAWQSVADYKGCIHFPYNISVMSVFEQYTANIPLFFPSKRYLLELWLNKVPVLDQWSWHSSNKQVPKSLIEHKHEQDPNNYADFNIVSNWLVYADYYSGVLPLIQYFDSKEEREAILGLSVKSLLNISEEMRAGNWLRKNKVYGQWARVLDRIHNAL